MQTNTNLGLKFISLNHSFDLYFNNIENKNGNILFQNYEISKFFFDFYNIFTNDIKRADDGHPLLQLNMFTKKTKGLNEKLKDFVNEYSDAMPQLNAFIKYFNQIEIDEIFCILPTNIILDTKNLLTVIKELYKYNNKEYVDIKDFYNDLFTDYNVHIYGDVKKYIGHSDKSKRICRWCHRSIKSNPAVTFSQKAHAISESLGNKTLILYDECDECNTKFSETIERSFTNLLMPFNTYFGIKGKNGIPKIKTNNTSMENLGNSQIAFSTNDIKFKDNKPHIFPLECGAIVLQDIYKALCKFALSVLEDENMLDKYKWTTEWIKSDNYFKQIPLVKTLFTYQFFPENPTINLFIRKTNNEGLPLIFALFYYKALVYAYIVPSSEEEMEKYLNKEIFEEFWAKIPFSKTQGWKDEDYSDSKKRPCVYNMVLEQKP